MGRRSNTSSQQWPVVALATLLLAAQPKAVELGQTRAHTIDWSAQLVETASVGPTSQTTLQARARAHHIQLIILWLGNMPGHKAALDHTGRNQQRANSRAIMLKH